MIAVVGSGVLGLAVAEYLSRRQPVVVISNEHPLTGSRAAAANLATKAQLFGRDAHFQLKLRARKMYRHWLGAMLAECGRGDFDLEGVFCEGAGLEFFHSSAACQRQLERVLQPANELTSRGLGTQPFQKTSETSLCYFNEAWVDASFCLNLLTEVLKKRNVSFVYENVVQHAQSINALKASYQVSQVVFCTGAWTTDVLAHFGLALQGSKRLTVGTTLVKNFNFLQVVNSAVLTAFGQPSVATPVALCEFHDVDVKNKVVLSGSCSQTFLSSTSERLASLADSSAAIDSLLVANARLENTADFYFKQLPETTLVKTGVRVGFGHTELVVKRLTHDVIVCCGAHKSGFLFAPVVGPLVSSPAVGNFSAV